MPRFGVSCSRPSAWAASIELRNCVEQPGGSRNCLGERCLGRHQLHGSWLPGFL